MSPTPSEPALSLHPLLKSTVGINKWRVDCHAHTYYSGDSTTTFNELKQSVESSGLNAIFITDHGSIEGALRLQGYLDCEIFVGQECKSSSGEIIGLFLSEKIPSGLSPKEIARRIRSQGGLVSIPHPFDPFRNGLREESIIELLEASLVDVIEVFNAKSSLKSARIKANETCEKWSLGKIAGSDAHVPSAFGAAFIVVDPFKDSDSFLKVVKNSDSFGHYFDPPRIWSPRVVPSNKTLK